MLLLRNKYIVTSPSATSRPFICFLLHSVLALYILISRPTARSIGRSDGRDEVEAGHLVQ
ncbi:hypothetical protein BCV69DRAFT_174871 [Microstroma glucosiphilum]|uniref:Uncharacterized protein n=1 Tax=Pseudomicrostroma glucosiphilum TaxID=1684307 RepID=A0A316U8L1_9BASI|nr:hypothetical protein BCV69DRAFT_174871 [Pseudomicrostroma glucosiphilum]PWN21590.1 hypothetical protein BCV69DRAFT_174871 [Pseudomicrostroma glucosiphilum]